VPGQVGPPVLKHEFKICRGKSVQVDDRGGEGEAPTPTKQRSQEFYADDNGLNYSFSVFEHDN
jgi:hypothetical protein